MAQVANQRWDYATMRTEKANIDKEIGTFDGITDRMEKVVQVLDRAMQGESLKQYKAAHNQVKGQYVQLKAMLESLSRTLSDSMNRMQAADENNAAMIKQQFGQFMG